MTWPAARAAGVPQGVAVRQRSREGGSDGWVGACCRHSHTTGCIAPQHLTRVYTSPTAASSKPFRRGPAWQLQLLGGGCKADDAQLGRLTQMPPEFPRADQIDAPSGCAPGDCSLTGCFTETWTQLAPCWTTKERSTRSLGRPSRPTGRRQGTACTAAGWSWQMPKCGSGRAEPASAAHDCVGNAILCTVGFGQRRPLQRRPRHGSAVATLPALACVI
jgi:hypothetical protein